LLYFALLRVEILFGTPLPPGLLQQLAPAAWRSWLVNLLAGPGALLQPSTNPRVRYPRFWLAYSAMLTPFSRSVDACAYYMFASTKLQSGSPFGDTWTAVQDIARGLTLTGLALTSSLMERIGSSFRRRLRLRDSQCLPLTGKVVS
jgi:hypothetical protein